MIKRFEQYNKDYYRKIRGSDLNAFISDRKNENLTESDIRKIDFIGTFEEMNLHGTPKSFIVILPKKYLILPENDFRRRILVRKYFDDWFTVCDFQPNPDKRGERFLTSYYLCDQIDGVVECLKNITED